jgi:hypothetical protein
LPSKRKREALPRAIALARASIDGVQDWELSKSALRQLIAAAEAHHLAQIGTVEQPAETEEQAAERELGAWLVAHPGWYSNPLCSGQDDDGSFYFSIDNALDEDHGGFMSFERTTRAAAIREALRLAKETP